MKDSKKKNFVPIWHKSHLSIREAVAYTGIGRNRLYRMTNREDCPFILQIGTRRLIKRQALEEYLCKASFI